MWVIVCDSCAAPGTAAGSDAATRPAEIVAERAPWKVSDRTVPGSTAAPSRVLAMVAPVTCSGLVPYRFDSRTRTRLPPLLTRGVRIRGEGSGQRRRGGRGANCGAADFHCVS